ncbi:hypothetical protein EMIHUDRAFT_219803 [Emiliania huxleyi CCMP1516]|uniref:EXPERA domain-containing protein n=2 Tax=Emiliania huxleyi TaxID=2903 RepID=A0A0D3I3B3_EMIH1|nr:hypothetical protein EMIHUDRAFT_219803 [Emiliania huxleyi CCMP1516]EOD05748.1 hypothetical protein EMIHUDRAFT_219803 [Emiliania huxleyi CCMP1516]|eukprot:XP_005758177.1 hypothetical protein EMIHUDRAFT_219803 [Emiliania huxleyi CCMP1516]
MKYVLTAAQAGHVGWHIEAPTRAAAEVKDEGGGVAGCLVGEGSGALGTIAGHVFPGSVILLLGLHWAAGIGRCIAVGAPYSRSWHALPWQRGVGARPWEPWLKVFFTFFMGILMELYYKDPWKYGLDWWWRPLISEDGAHFTFVDSWHHACMHLAFLACGLLELGGFYLAAKGYASPLQCSLELAMLALAFALETIMGVLHALGGEGLPAEIHKMQTLFFTVAAAAAISEASHGGHARIAPFVRVTATVAAGVWMCFNALVYAWQSNGNSAWARDPMAAHPDLEVASIDGDIY